MLASEMLSRFQASISEECKQFNWLIKACSRPNILKERNITLMSPSQGQSIPQERKTDKD